MLFSDETVAAEINEKFEPVWVSVREVPTVTIDFGKGHVLKRTLHGNVASYVLTADGTIVDILPGLYEPQAYISQLNQLWWLHHYLPRVPDASAFLADYHGAQISAIKTSGKAREVRPFADMSKSAIEYSTKGLLLAPGYRTRVSSVPNLNRADPPDFSKPNQLSHWKKIYEDTELNETERRAQVHAMLAKMPNAKPQDVTKRLYREILHADLDDPYLGLGETLFTNYPFREDMPDSIHLAESAQSKSSTAHK